MSSNGMTYADSAIALSDNRVKDAGSPPIITYEDAGSPARSRGTSPSGNSVYSNVSDKAKEEPPPPSENDQKRLASVPTAGRGTKTAAAARVGEMKSTQK